MTSQISIFTNQYQRCHQATLATFVAINKDTANKSLLGFEQGKDYNFVMSELNKPENQNYRAEINNLHKVEPAKSIIEFCYTPAKKELQDSNFPKQYIPLVTRLANKEMQPKAFHELGGYKFENNDEVINYQPQLSIFVNFMRECLKKDSLENCIKLGKNHVSGKTILDDSELEQLAAAVTAELEVAGILQKHEDL